MTSENANMPEQNFVVTESVQFAHFRSINDFLLDKDRYQVGFWVNLDLCLAVQLHILTNFSTISEAQFYQSEAMERQHCCQSAALPDQLLHSHLVDSSHRFRHLSA